MGAPGLAFTCCALAASTRRTIFIIKGTKYLIDHVSALLRKSHTSKSRSREFKKSEVAGVQEANTSFSSYSRRAKRIWTILAIRSTTSASKAAMIASPAAASRKPRNTLNLTALGNSY